MATPSPQVDCFVYFASQQEVPPFCCLFLRRSPSPPRFFSVPFWHHPSGGVGCDDLIPRRHGTLSRVQQGLGKAQGDSCAAHRREGRAREVTSARCRHRRRHCFVAVGVGAIIVSLLVLLFVLVWLLLLLSLTTLPRLLLSCVRCRVVDWVCVSACCCACACVCAVKRERLP